MVLAPDQLPFCRFKASWFVFSDTSFQLASEASASAAAGPKSGIRGSSSNSSALGEPPATSKHAGKRQPHHKGHNNDLLVPSHQTPNSP